ncbi:MAG: 3-dehydroquinate synthase, partial [Dehalococcoidia bacterium]
FKTLEAVNFLYERFIKGGLDRSSVVLALGGGVIGDTAGFAAATYMRGVPLVHLPTTLVAIVDSSIGGKVGVDHPRAKNLIGAFYQPRLIAADLAALNTLPDIEFRCGLAEVVKVGVISSPALFAHLEKEGPTPLSWVIEESIAVKVRVVEEDPFEQGRRAVLNLGHTFGHAFESLSHYTLRHGEAVSRGMVVAARVAVELGLCEEAIERRLVSLLAEFGLPVAWEGFELEPEQVWEAMALDKKKRGKALRFVLPKGIGEVIVTEQVPKGVVLRALEETHGEKQNPCHSRTKP